MVPEERDREPCRRAGLRRAELIALVATLMATNALAIDIMLPALGLIARDLSVASDNDRQLVVLAYVLGLGVAQLVAGPLGDRFGRKPVLIVCVLGYSLAGLLGTFAGTFWLLVASRAVQGMFAAGPRTLSVSLVRDLYEGVAMARLMSLVMMVFMIIPIAAPAIGQGILLVAHWRWTFGVLVLFGLVLAAWMGLRLKETLNPEARRPLSVSDLAASYRQVITTRQSRGYTIASGLVFGSLFAYLSSSEQLFGDTYDAAAEFALYFALIAVFMTASAFVNSRVVERVGVKRVAHRALLGFVAIAAIQALLAGLGVLGLWPFVLSMSGLMFAFGLIGPNFTTLAMTPLGNIAGTASAVLGFASTAISAVLGGFVARQFDGTPLPFAVGVLLLGASALVVVLHTERFRLFAPD